MNNFAVQQQQVMPDEGIDLAIDAHVAESDPHTQYVKASSLSELIDDRVAALLAAGSNISLSYNDATNTLVISASGGGGGGGGNGYFPSGF